MLERRELPSLEILSAFLHYNPETGQFHWRNPGQEMFTSLKAWRAWTVKHAGKPAGGVGNHGYARFMVAGQRMLAHRVAYFMMHGIQPDIMDHINGDRTDNRIANLRPATAQANALNGKIRESSKSGVPGVTLTNGKWQAYIRADNRLVHLGFFVDRDEAIAVRKAAEQVHGYEVRAVQ